MALTRAGPSNMAGTVLVIPVLSTETWKNGDIKLHCFQVVIELLTEMESLMTGSSSSHFDLPHNPLLLHYLATVFKRAINKARGS